MVISNIFCFHPYLGKIPILTFNIFQRGWNRNHQLESNEETQVCFAVSFQHLANRSVIEATEGIYPTADGWVPPAWPSNEDFANGVESSEPLPSRKLTYFSPWKRKNHRLKHALSGDMGVSKNRGTPKWMLYNGKPYQNGWFGGTIVFGNTHMSVFSGNFPGQTRISRLPSL